MQNGNAEDAGRRIGLSKDRCFGKPEWNTPDNVDMPTVPDLVIDDNKGESVLSYPHIVVPTFNGKTDDHIFLDIFPKIRDYIESKAESRLLNLLKRLSENFHATVIT